MVGEELIASGAEGMMTGDLSGFFSIIAAFLVIFLIIVVVLYVFMGFAFMAIAKKAKLSMPGLAWIPFIGPSIICFQASKMHWWPWLLLLGSAIPILGIFTGIAFAVVSVIWLWKTFEAINKPNWWALLTLIPFLNLIMIGIAAWSKD